MKLIGQIEGMLFTTRQIPQLELPSPWTIHIHFPETFRTKHCISGYDGIIVARSMARNTVAIVANLLEEVAAFESCG
jgi:hypothetical protein